MRQDYNGRKRFIIVLAVMMFASLLLPTGEEMIGGGYAAVEDVHEEEDVYEDDSGEYVSDSLGLRRMTAAVYVEGESGGSIAAAGSGVIVDMSQDELCIATAGHVLERAQSNSDISVVFGDDLKIQCDEYIVMQDADLAFIGIDCANISKDAEDYIAEKYSAAQTDKETYDMLSQGDKVYAAGYREEEFVIYEGILEDAWIMSEDFEQYIMAADCEVYSGMSGGGLFDASGMPIGIVCGGDGQGKLAAVPFHIVWAQFENMRYNSTT